MIFMNTFFKKGYYIIPVLLLIIIFSGCKNNSEEPIISHPIPDWIPNSFVQPIPDWGSSIRLVLPVPISQIYPELIGGFGSHQGGHPEGLDHVWMEVRLGIPIWSWASGTVTEIQDQAGEYFIVIDYGDGLIGKHMEVKTSLVKKGDHVNAGQAVGYGLSYGAYQSAEFMLYDRKRTDGVVEDWGVHVSPFDYLKKDIQDSLIKIYQASVIIPFISKNKSFGSVNPWEPLLTNPVLFHRNYKGTIAGEWLLNSKWAVGGYPDILTMMDVNNTYFQGKRFVAADDQSTGGNNLFGTWEADYKQQRFQLFSQGSVYFGIFELKDSTGRATLKIEYNNVSYPSGFSQSAVVYTERSNVPRIIDAQNMGAAK
jgi:hypothetical protein